LTVVEGRVNKVVLNLHAYDSDEGVEEDV